MSEVASRYFKAEARREKEREPKLHAAERAALLKLRKEARQNGATLATGGKGGLPPSLVLGVMRRDGYKCKRCGTQTDLSVHHKGGLENPTSRWLAKQGHNNDPNNLVTVCLSCHDAIHDEDRARGEGK